ncbi:MAG: transcriptional repressor [Pseudomonadales bacterium]|nr:transcriptional repressor [Candidatus Woesebacteria bacterium]MCB9801575.1 transcriptional repressor [Pseudomonadales bacterium]
MQQRTLKETLVKLLQTHHLLSVSDILTLLEKNKTSYNKTSVYRALEQLLDEDVICRHHFSPTEATYELREHHHAHLVCTQCGSIEEGECAYQEPHAVGSFRVNHHHTTLFGICGGCG